MKYGFVDLFAGCGGFSLGLLKAGLKPLFAIEKHPDAFASLHHNLHPHHEWPSWLEAEPHDLLEVLSGHHEDLEALRGHVDLVVGGPPCQGFSTNGRRDPSDPRNELATAYLAFVKTVAPRFVVMENVRGFTSMRFDEQRTYSDMVEGELQELGYDTRSSVIRAADWGVPQRRPRFLLIGVLRDGSLEQSNHPYDLLLKARKNFKAIRGLGEETSAMEALDDLRTKFRSVAPDPEFPKGGFGHVVHHAMHASTNYAKLMSSIDDAPTSSLRLPRHTERVANRFKEMLETCPHGKCLSPADRKRLGIKKRSTTVIDGSKPSPTVTTLPDDIVHYSEPRILTVRELARLQSFPDNFVFKGPYTTGGKRRKTACPRYTQVGNAVPPLLAEAIGEAIVTYASSRNLSESI